VALLAYLADHAGRVVPRDELLGEVWGHHPRSRSRAVDKTLARLRRKLGDDPACPRWVRTIRGEGYRFGAASSAATPVEGPPPTSFHGRQRELVALGQALDDGHRLVTLVGPGGIGKTRLARQLIAGRGGWTAVAELAEARGADEVLAGIAAAVEVPLVGTDPAAVVGRALGARRDGVLLLDNLEHVLDVVAPWVQAWLAGAGSLRIVGTSRAPLGLPGERVVEVDRLPPEAACALLEDRSGWAAGESLAQLAEALEGVPLALELVAAVAPALSAREVTQRLGQVLRHARLRGVPPRHASMEAALAWSYDRLAPCTQRALRECTVFRGPFTLEAALAVVDGPDALGRLLALRRGSLLRRVGDRLGVFEVVRTHAAVELTASERTAARTRHARFVAEVAFAALQGAPTHGGREAVKAVVSLADVRAAWAWAVAAPHPLQAHRLGQVLGALRHPTAEVAGQLEQTLAVAVAPQVAARTRLALASTLIVQGREERAAQLLADLEADAVADCDRQLELEVLRTASIRPVPGRSRLDDAQRAVALADGAAAAVRAAAQCALGVVLRDAGRFVDSRRAFRAAAIAYRDCGDRSGEAQAISGELAVLHRREELVAAVERLERHRARVPSAETRDLLGMQVALLELQLGRADAAVQRAGRLAASYRRRGDRVNALIATANQGLAQLDAGHVSSAVATLRRCVQEARAHDSSKVAVFATDLALALLVAGERSEAAALLDEGSREAVGDAWVCVQAVRHALRGDDAAVDSLTQPWSNDGHAPVKALLMAAAQGDATEAARSLRAPALHALCEVRDDLRAVVRALRPVTG